MKRILFFQLDVLKASPFTKHIENTVDLFEGKGIETIVCTIYAYGSHKDACIPKAKIIPLLPKSTKTTILPAHWRAIPKLAKVIRQYKPSAVVVRGLPLALPALLARIISFCIAKYAVSLHINAQLEAQHRLHRSSVLFPIISTLFLPCYELVWAVSTGAASSYQKYTHKKIYTIYNPVVIKSLATKAREPVQHRFIDERDQNDEIKLLIAIGRLAPEKDYPMMLKAVRQVGDRLNVRLLILGDGREKQAIERWVQELSLTNQVDLVGRVANPYKYLLACDCFLLSSTHEGLPGSLIQALALGCQCVATDCPSGPAEVLSSSKYGWLSPVGDYCQFGNNIIQALTYPIPRDVLRKRSLEFTAEEHVNKLLDLLSFQDL